MNAFVFSIIFLLIVGKSEAIATKLCANEACTETLFVSKINRAYETPHTGFAKPFKEGGEVIVTAFMFSNYPHYMEGKVIGGESGLFYSSHIDMIPYIEFLQKAIKENREYFIIDTDNQALKRRLGKAKANPSFIKTYEVKATEANLPVEQFESEEHAHSHGHGHSHEHGHSHSHGHGHSHGHDDNQKKPETEGIKSTQSDTTTPIPESTTVTSNSETAATITVTSLVEPQTAASASPESTPPTTTVTSPVEPQTATPESPESTPPTTTVTSSVEPQAPEPANTAAPKNPEIVPPLQTINPINTETEQKPNELPNEKITLASIPELSIDIPIDVDKQTSDASNISESNPTTNPPQEPSTGLSQIELDQPTTPAPVTPPNILNLNPTDQLELIMKHQQNVFNNINENLPIEQPTMPPSSEPTTELDEIDQYLKSIKLEAVLAAQTEQTPYTETVTTTSEPILKNEETKLEINEKEHLTLESITEHSNVVPTKNEPVIMQEPHPDIRQQQASIEEGYCHKEDCDKLYNNMQGVANAHSSIDNSSIRFILNEYATSVRILLPYPLSDFDNTGILVFAFLVVFIMIHVLNICLSGRDLHKDVVDKRLLHDCMTRLKEQEVELQKSRVSAVNSYQLTEARSLIDQLNKEKANLTKLVSNLGNENKELKSLCEKSEHEVAVSARRILEFQDAIETKSREVKNLNDEINGLTERNNSLSNDLISSRKNLDVLRHDHEVLQSDYKDLKMENQKLNDRLENSEKELNTQRAENIELHNKTDEFLIIIRELRSTTRPVKSSNKTGKSLPPLDSIVQDASKTTTSSDSSGNVIVEPDRTADVDNSLEQDDNGGGSGGSVGWSDLSEADVTDTKLTEEKLAGIDENANDDQLPSQVPSRKGSVELTSQGRLKDMRKVKADLFEIAELKSKIRKLETERDSLRLTLDSEEKEKVSLLIRLEQVKQDLAEKRREAEQRETDRHELQSQCQKLLHMVEEKDRKLQNTEEERDRLRNKISERELELRKVEDEKREISLKLREVEQTLRRYEEHNGKLENKIFHEERRLNSRIRQLEEQISKMHSLSPNNSALGDLNLSGNSSDRDFGARMPGELPSLWSDVGSDSQYDALNELDRRGVGSSGGSLRLRSRKSLHNTDSLSRGSPFELEEYYYLNRNNSMKERRTSTNNLRARSRSAGRQPSGRQSAKLVGVMSSLNPNSTPVFLQK